MGYDWQRELGEAVPRIFPNEAKRKAAYRLLSNKKVSMNDIFRISPSGDGGSLWAV